MRGYDSEPDTRAHIRRVQGLIAIFCHGMVIRSETHDLSKLENPEKELFDKYTPLLKDVTYGSDKYFQYLKELKPALDHHYANNSHHPEHYENGIDGMNLFDLVEMFLDWKAASERHADGDIVDSIKKNQVRFGMSDQLTSILLNTARKMFNHESHH